MKRFPMITLALTALATGLMFLPQHVQQRLYLESDGGRWWSLITGHWLHADVAHLGWNLTALVILGAFIEGRSKVLLISAVIAGMIGVNALLLSPAADIQYYCGLSGLLNTLLGVVLWLLWRSSRNPLVVLAAVLSALKIVVEVAYGGAVFTDISVPSYPLSHLAGLLATPMALWLWQWGAGRLPGALALIERVSKARASAA